MFAVKKKQILLKIALSAFKMSSTVAVRKSIMAIFARLKGVEGRGHGF